ncbi:Uncharacterised protein [Mycobacteroides abscessus subsp. abscessus]|nr:Uncharacterised protein [Mycobacteroides abscessus subsp. abscessus]
MSPVAMMTSGCAPLIVLVSTKFMIAGLPVILSCIHDGGSAFTPPIATGWTPSDRTASASPGPIAAIAVGASLISVLPCTWLNVWAV